jgi:DNA-directed RNA polymerase subunit H (RpoH/RPB5)
MEARDDSLKQIVEMFFVVFDDNSKYLKKSNELIKILLVCKNLYGHSLRKIVMIVRSKLSNILKNKIKLLSRYGIVLEVISFSQFIFNPIEHVNFMNTSVNKLDVVEARDLLRFIDMDKDYLHYICIDDPVCTWFDCNVGDIVKFTKPSPIQNGMTCNYRLVINKALTSRRTILNYSREPVPLDKIKIPENIDDIIKLLFDKKKAIPKKKKVAEGIKVTDEALDEDELGDDADDLGPADDDEDAIDDALIDGDDEDGLDAIDDEEEDPVELDEDLEAIY